MRLQQEPAPRTSGPCDECGEPAVARHVIENRVAVEQASGGYLPFEVLVCADPTCRAKARSTAFIYGSFTSYGRLEPLAEQPELF